MDNHEENRAALAESLQHAYSSSGDYVTQGQLSAALGHIETKISNSELRQRNWVLVGCLAIIISFGGGYMSLVGKIDKLSDSMPGIVEVQEGRRVWMIRKDQRDSDQDQVLKSVVPKYIPQPYGDVPK